MIKIERGGRRRKEKNGEMQSLPFFSPPPTTYEMQNTSKIVRVSVRDRSDWSPSREISLFSFTELLAPA